MRFPLSSLYSMNRSKPIVELYGIDGELQWDTWEKEALQTERIATHAGGKPTMTDIRKVQYLTSDENIVKRTAQYIVDSWNIRSKIKNRLNR